MPFKSESQRQKFQQLVKAGKLSKEKYAEFEKGTPKDLPERVTPKNTPQVRGVRRIIR